MQIVLFQIHSIFLYLSMPSKYANSLYSLIIIIHGTFPEGLHHRLVSTIQQVVHYIYKTAFFTSKSKYNEPSKKTKLRCWIFFFLMKTCLILPAFVFSSWITTLVVPFLCLSARSVHTDLVWKIASDLSQIKVRKVRKLAIPSIYKPITAYLCESFIDHSKHKLSSGKKQGESELIPFSIIYWTKLLLSF